MRVACPRVCSYILSKPIHSFVNNSEVTLLLKHTKSFYGTYLKGGQVAWWIGTDNFLRDGAFRMPDWLLIPGKRTIHFKICKRLLKPKQMSFQFGFKGFGSSFCWPHMQQSFSLTDTLSPSFGHNTVLQPFALQFLKAQLFWTQCPERNKRRQRRSHGVHPCEDCILAGPHLVYTRCSGVHGPKTFQIEWRTGHWVDRVFYRWTGEK